MDKQIARELYGEDVIEYMANYVPTCHNYSAEDVICIEFYTNDTWTAFDRKGEVAWGFC
jgi:hypothetical protein